MILTVGLSPVWQHILRLDALHVGEVNRAREVDWLASGKAINVAVALAHLGAECRALSLLGGRTRELVIRDLESLGVRGRWIETHWATRVCTTILDGRTGVATELVENAGPITPAELDEFTRAYREEAARADVVVFSGSLPAGAPASIYGDLLANGPARAIVDARGEELLLTLPHKPLVVKPNREELARTIGQPLDNERAVRHAMRELVVRGAQWVVVTHGAAGILVSSADGEYRVAPPRMAVVNPIGSGDSLAAGLAYGLVKGQTVLDALRLGVAAAGENVRHVFPARLDPARVEELAASIKIEELPG